MSIQWTEQLAVGNALIDAQHRELLERFNDLLEACRRQEGKERLGKLLAFLDDYTRTHFREEEALMKRHAYPEAARHGDLHRGFVARLSELQRTLADRGPALSVVVETNQALLKWILEHIKREDVKVGRFLRENAA